MTSVINQTADGNPIILYRLRIRSEFINDDSISALTKHLKSIFSNYGKIYSFEAQEKIVIIGYDNIESRDVAIQNEDGQCSWKSKKLSVERQSAALMNRMSILKKKRNHPKLNINEMTKCNNYWNKDIYPENVIQDTLLLNQNNCITISSVDAPKGVFKIYCYHKYIKHPFMIHMTSLNKSINNIIHIRPLTIREIGVMPAHCLWCNDISNYLLIKQLLPHNKAFGVDWRYYKLWHNKPLLYIFGRLEFEPHRCIKYMIDTLKCDINDSRYSLLHHAASRHDIGLLNWLLMSDKIDVHQKSVDKYKETALEKCNWSWSNHKKKYNKNVDNIVELKKEEKNNDNDDVYILSMYVRNMLYNQPYGVQTVVLLDVDEAFKTFAQFTVQFIDTGCCIIKIKKDSKSYKRICEKKTFLDINSDLVLTANIDKKTVDFQVYNKLNEQHWSIDKISNFYQFSVYIGIEEIKQFILMTSDNCRTLEIQEIDNNIINDHDPTKSLFAILRKYEFSTGTEDEYDQHFAYRSCLKGDIKICQDIHQEIVDKLENAMKVQNTEKWEKISQDEHKEMDNKWKQKKTVKIERNTLSSNSKNKGYKAPKTVHKYDENKMDINYKRNSNRCSGFVKRYVLEKGFGFIQPNDGGNNIFVHKSEIKAIGFQSLSEGEFVEFDVVIQDDGRRKAINVTGPNNDYVKGQKSNYYNNNNVQKQSYHSNRFGQRQIYQSNNINTFNQNNQ